MVRLSRSFRKVVFSAVIFGREGDANAVTRENVLNRIRGSLMIPVVVWSAMCGVSPDVAACDGGSRGWTLTESELVAQTPEIFLGRVIASRSNETNPLRYDYLFEVVESIKGARQPSPRWLGPFRSVSSEIPAANEQRVTVLPDCGLGGSFQTGRQYLVFQDSRHPKGYELVPSDNDAWLKTVRRLANAGAAASRLPR
jgi:hypothetical protein